MIFFRQGQANQMMPMQQGNPAATGASSTAANTTPRDLPAVHNQAMQQHAQAQQRGAVYSQQTGYTSTAPDRQIPPVSI